MKLLLLSCALCLLIALSSCGGNSTNPSEQVLGIHGKVVDANGKPIAGAEIVQVYKPLRDGFNSKKEDVQGDTVEIKKPLADFLGCSPLPVTKELFNQFEVEVAMPVSLSIVEVLTGQTITTLASNRMLDAGSHVWLWKVIPDGSSTASIRNGVYRIHLVKNKTVIEKDILVNTRRAAAVAVTDSEGKFFIDYKHFPIGFRSDVIDVNGRALGIMEVSSACTLFVRQHDAVVQEQDITVHKEKAMEVVLTVPQ